MIDLSICIPTYNRCDFLKEALDSIIEQLSENLYDRVEIVISDNCSTDGTELMIEKIKNKNSRLNLVYSIADDNLGADRNYLRVISLANGEYCWFLGSDDKIADNSLILVMNQIKDGHTIYISDRYDAKLIDMEIIGESEFYLPEIKRDTIFEFKDERDWDFYLNRCNSLGAIFSYLSVIVFERKRWIEISNSAYDTFIGTAYVHVAVLFNILKNDYKCTLKYLKSPLAINRTGNDTFYENVYKRTMLDINGYISLSNIFDQSEIIRNDIRRIIKKEHPTVHWRLILKTNDREFSDLIIKLKYIGYSMQEIQYFKMARSKKILSLMIVFLDKIKYRISKIRG